MAQVETRPRQRRGNSVTMIGMAVAILAIIGLYSNGFFDLPQTLNQTDDMSVVQAGISGGTASYLRPIPGQLWEMEATGLVRYDGDQVSVSTDNNLILDTAVGTVTENSSVTVSDREKYPQLKSLLPAREWVVRAKVNAVLHGPRDGEKIIVTMTVTPLGEPEIIPVPQG